MRLQCVACRNETGVASSQWVTAPVAAAYEDGVLVTPAVAGVELGACACGNGTWKVL